MNYIKFIKIYILVIIVICVGLLVTQRIWAPKAINTISDTQNIESPNTIDKITFKSSGGLINTEAMVVGDYAYAHYLLGTSQSLDIRGGYKRYGFYLDGDTLNISKIAQNNSKIIATIDLQKFASKLAQLKEFKGPDPNGYDNNFSREEMSLNFNNENIKLKIYIDEIDGHKEESKFQVDALKGLILFTPL